MALESLKLSDTSDDNRGDDAAVDIFSEGSLEIVSFAYSSSTSSPPKTVENKISSFCKSQNLMEVKIYNNINFYRQIGTQTSSYQPLAPMKWF